MSPLKEFAHLRIPLEEIKSATDNFADEHIIGRGGSGYVYEGQLLHRQQLIDIAVKRLDWVTSYGQGDKELWTDFQMRSSLKHENLVSIVGFCDEADEKIIVNKLQVNGSLDKYLSDPTFTWLQRLHVCVGTARALSYIHYDTGRSYDVIHHNIKSSKIMLDGNWDAKLSGFGLSAKVLATRRHRLVLDNTVVGTIGYVDPVCVETGTVTHKSDVYSFGVVLFELLCGRRALTAEDAGKYQSLSPMATLHYEEGKLDEIIDPYLRKQMHPESYTIFSDTAYHCLKKQRAQRPDMEKVAKRLEKAWELQWKHENPVHSKIPLDGTSSNNLKAVEHLRIPLTDIIAATNNFTKGYLGSGGYGKVYAAELDLPIEGKNKGEVSKKQKTTVAIKCITKDANGKEGFVAEIELLTRCKHDNIVSLLGFCDEGDQLILVYEHVSNGSLDDYLGVNHKLTNLTWVQRLKICTDIARGLKYLHTTKAEDEQSIVHRDIKSGNILLSKNWVAKIADFGLSKFHHVDEQEKTRYSKNIAGTYVYMCPEYRKGGKFKRAIDIYSFGVVLFEILSGKPAYDDIYITENEVGIAHVARRHFKEQTLNEMVDPIIMEEVDELASPLNKGPDQDSLKTFLAIAHKCVAETQKERPSAEQTLEELEKALLCQENNKDKLQISLEDIKLATQNFSYNNLIGNGDFGNVYKGEVINTNGHHIIAAKRLDRKRGQGESEFLKELEVLLEYKNDNVIGLVGYCDEMDEKIIVYEYATRNSLDRYLSCIDFTWMERLKVCIDVASGLEFLHGGVVTQEVVIHRDIKSSNILLTNDWKAKISDFGLSLISPKLQEMDYIIDSACGTYGYVDPQYLSSGFLSKESDIYSLGLVLFEILCGRIAVDSSYHGAHRFLSNLAKSVFDEGKVEQIVFKGISDQIVPESLTAYSTIAYQCLHNVREKRPTISEVLVQLKKALEFQEDYEIWEPRLPRDYKEIIQMSKYPEIFSAKSNKDLFNMFSKGILLQEGKVWFSLGANGKRNEMISAREFSYKNRRSHKWRSILETRFEKVAEMLDISKLKTQIKITTRFLSPGVNYGVYLVFKFCIPRTVSSTPMYVNLTYKRGNETLHSYFATWRDDGWMMIELCRFLTHKEEAHIEILLESFSRYYCKSGSIYIEGIEFRAIDDASSKAKHEEIEKLKEVQQVLESSSSTDEVQQSSTSYKEIFTTSENHDEGEKLLSLDEMNKKKSHMLSARDALYDSSNAKLFTLKPSADSRFKEVIELLSQQVLHIKCKIGRQMLSPNTIYMCYLVFKLSEMGCGLNCPVIVRDLLKWKNKETEVVYFRSPSPLNCHHGNRVPEKRVDGWMEVNVWKFNSNEFKNDSLPANLKLICYEGTMSGLIVHGFEFRPV